MKNVLKQKRFVQQKDAALPNIALFLVGLPASITDPVLIFIGCYQVPMYLTPLLMRRFYAHG